MKKQSCADPLLISARLLLLLLATDCVVRAQTGSYFPITNIKDPYLQEVGQFAVKEYNRESKGELKFVKVLNGEEQAVAGYSYKLVLAAESGSVTTNYEAVVWEDPQQVTHLVSFNHVIDN
ncbi:cysteine proteinase inhibitor 1-like [Pistacia vera]|uniref:cysteine proteinase inhibitor 1-like n=1 Tax=Pistacia vera TaxID=55513 RepID=UPI001262EBD8|nr:cysteine proteinase inhibitor 1-like [Pistacia vera]